MKKEDARELVWRDLVKVAKPDSRFHFDFNEFIPDFDGSNLATQKLISMEIYKQAKTIFVTPDNCLERLRAQSIKDKKNLLVSTFGIHRGFVELLPENFDENCVIDYLVLLDLMEEVGRPISLMEIQEKYHIDLVVTGASAVNKKGIRFGKGHGYFDLEWAMFYTIGAVSADTSVIALVHDCQFVDVELEASELDSLCDFIITPSKVYPIEIPRKPQSGVNWNKLQPNMLEQIPPLRELKEMKIS
jgi:5-formyltetrahydrofolate cyclo-ligase